MYVIYIYDKNKNLLTQFFQVSQIEVQEKLNEVSSASFIISNRKEFYNYTELARPTFGDLHNEKIIDYKNKSYIDLYVKKSRQVEKNLVQYNLLKEGNIVDIYKMVEDKEKRLFYGIIKGVKSNLDFCEIRCTDFLYLLKKKILFDDKKITNTIKNILEEIAAEVNMRDNGFISQVICNINETTTVEYRKGKTLFDILRDLAGDVYEFCFEDKILYFQETIGENKTSGPNIVLFEYNIVLPESNTISKAEVEYDIENIVNSLYSEDGNILDSESIEKYGVLEKGFSKGEKSKILDENKNSLKEFNITPISPNYFVCNVGDQVRVYIDSGTEMLQYDGTLKVVEKRFRSGDLDTVDFKLNSGKMRTKNIIETISDLKSDVKDLKS